MSQQMKQGRRTPLTLGSQHHGKNRKNSSESGDSRSSTPSVNMEKVTVDIEKLKPETTKVDNNKTVPKVDNNKTVPKVDNNKTVPKASNIQTSTTENGQKNGVKKQNGSENKDVPVAAAKKESVAAATTSPSNNKEEKEVKHQNGSKASIVAPTSAAVAQTPTKKTDVAAATPPANDDKTEQKQPKEAVVRESPRQKEIREAKEKEDQQQKQTNDAEAAEKSKKAAADMVPKIVLTPVTPEVAKPSPKKKDTTDVPQNDKNSEEMEPLHVDSEIEDSPMPPKSKILKLNQSSSNRARVSPFRRNEKNISTLVNLSTVSEQSVDLTNVSSEQILNSPFGNITGRKSLRPLRELSFQHNMRESYRPIQHDDSFSSMNATVGSETRDCFGTPVIAVKGRKRTANEDEGDEDITESPKKPRLDLTALFTLMASPMTMLKRRFSRANLCSTPNIKEHLDIETEGGNIQANEKNVSGIEEANDAMDIATEKQSDAETITEIEDVFESDNVDLDKANLCDKIPSDTNEAAAAEEAPVIIHSAPKKMCNVM